MLSVGQRPESKHPLLGGVARGRGGFLFVSHVPRGEGELICLLIEDEKPAIIRTETTNNVGIFPSPHSRSMLGGDRLERFRPWLWEGDVPDSQMWQRAFPMGELALQRLSFGIRIHGEILGFRRDEERV